MQHPEGWKAPLGSGVSWPPILPSCSTALCVCLGKDRRRGEGNEQSNEGSSGRKGLAPHLFLFPGSNQHTYSPSPCPPAWKLVTKSPAPELTCQSSAVPWAAVADPEVLYLLREAPSAASALCSPLPQSSPVLPTPSLCCRMPCIQLWFPGNKTTIKVSGTAGDLHHILSCMDSIFNTQY